MFRWVGQVSRWVGQLSRWAEQMSRWVGQVSREVGQLSRLVGQISRWVGQLTRWADILVILVTKLNRCYHRDSLVLELSYFLKFFCIVRASTLNVLNEEYSWVKRKDSIWITQCIWFTIVLFLFHDSQIAYKRILPVPGVEYSWCTSPPTGPGMYWMLCWLIPS